jgi:hypothetical protein
MSEKSKITTTTTEKSKKKINSKQKGKSFEGEIAKILSKSLAPYIFKRVIFSGAIMGGKNAKVLNDYSSQLGNLFVGDVTCVNAYDINRELEFRYNVECKFYKNPETLDNFFEENKSNIPMWFEESKIDAHKVKKEPLLIVKWNRSNIYCFMDQNNNIPKHIKCIPFSHWGIKCVLLKDILETKDQYFWFKNIDKPNFHD